jgi:ArsR family transcriptional regulator, lead/cadmium/zinc/bismuth-responsive transcriptional repressor
MMEKDKDTCEIYCYDELKVLLIQESLKNQDIQGMTKMVKVLALTKRG